ncbi:hypothetical protein J422_00736 [Methanocaldococcus villosus KIN24-T80]|uniref:MnmC-like methyltransferase domain-containing protein n=1 Tax=Methanocaldococcus villosus KIN24-T80 TaxID=1069083 RepID=N6VU50_9EURY|nr:MnmC family methyltransferase [Methanocaldococcus villosus]ENN96721.1 hypothetical protein J422_00736 [Methanocaldococcus villosus KIN24-T80]
MLVNSKALSIIRKYIKKYNLENEDYIKGKIINELKEKNLLVETEDGSLTLVSEDINEMMHSRIGALTEAIYKFVKPSNLEKMKEPKILDLCSGLCYNAVAALHFNKRAKIDMVEISEEVLFLSLFLDIPFEEHEIIKDKIREHFLPNYKSEHENIKLYIEDARKFIKKSQSCYDIVFHDAFSPKRDPTLYTYDFLREVYLRLKNGGVLLSYSSSIPFRSALVDNSFIISEEESLDRKRCISLAYKNRWSKRINEVDERVIALSITALPYRDKKLNARKEEIINEREKNKMILKDILTKKGKYISTKKIKKGKIPKELLDIQKENLNSTEIIKKMRKTYYGYYSFQDLIENFSHLY